MLADSILADTNTFVLAGFGRGALLFENILENVSVSVCCLYPWPYLALTDIGAMKTSSDMQH